VSNRSEISKFLLRRHSLSLVFLAILYLVSSLLEIVSLASIIPLVGLLSDQQDVTTWGAPTIKNYLQPMLDDNYEITIVMIFCTGVLSAAMIRLTSLYFQSTLAQAAGASFSKKVFEQLIYIGYERSFGWDRSSYVSAISVKVNIIVQQLFLPILNILGSLLILTFILIFLFFTIPRDVLYAFPILAGSYVVLSILTKRIVRSNGVVVSHKATVSAKLLNNAISGYRDIVLGGTQQFYLSIFSQNENKMRRAMAENQILATAPKYLVEAMALIAFAVYLFTISQTSSTTQVSIDNLLLLAFAAQKMMPQLQVISASVARMNGGYSAVLDVFDLIDTKNHKLDNTNKSELSYSFGMELNSLDVNHLSYYYESNKKDVLKDISLSINKGEWICLIGRSGSGKSTFMDVLLGLLIAKHGDIQINGVVLCENNLNDWYELLGHVPQDIFITDASLKENILMGRQFDPEKFKIACDISCVSEFICDLPYDFSTRLGDYGGLLSGGQKQRIGIARALYSNPKILFLDEATSALDEACEIRVLNNLKNYFPDITVIAITHNLNFKSFCDREIKFH